MKKSKRYFCFWNRQEDDDGKYFDTGCGGEFCFELEDLSARDNGFFYCPYCGKIIKEKLPVKDSGGRE